MMRILSLAAMCILLFCGLSNAEQTTVILKINTDIKKASEACVSKIDTKTVVLSAKSVAERRVPIEKFADSTATRDIDVFPWNSSEISNGYIRVPIENDYLPMFIKMFEKEHPDMDLVLVEADGQTRFVTGKELDEKGKVIGDTVLGCVGTIPIEPKSWEVKEVDPIKPVDDVKIITK